MAMHRLGVSTFQHRPVLNHPLITPWMALYTCGSHVHYLASKPCPKTLFQWQSIPTNTFMYYICTMQSSLCTFITPSLSKPENLTSIHTLHSNLGLFPYSPPHIQIPMHFKFSTSWTLDCFSLSHTFISPLLPAGQGVREIIGSRIYL